MRAYLTVATDRARAKLAASNLPGSSIAAKALSIGQMVQAAGNSMGGGLGIDLGAHRYRLSEECLLADRDCIVMGTCVENPRPQDDHDRNLITRGENEKTFLISSLTEQKTEKDLRSKALILILVGSLFMIVAAFFVLSFAELL